MTMIGLAARNVFRNKRRSLLNIVAVALGVALMFVCLGWVQGYETYIFKALRSFQTGSAQVLAAGYQAAAARFPLDLTVGDYRGARAALLAQDGVSGASGRLDFPVRLIAADASVRLLGQGVDGKDEAGVTVLPDKIVRGAYLGDGPGLLLGAKLAGRLRVEPGAVITVAATDRYGVENRIALPLSGLFDFGFAAMDNQIAFIDLASAQYLLDLGDEVTRVVLAGAAADRVEAAARRFAADRAASRPDLPALLAYGWQEFAKATVSGVRTDTYSFYVVAAILFALIIVGILNSMSMAVHERRRELCALRAVGFRAKDVRRLILYESLVLAAIATAAGLALAAPLAVWLGYFGLDIASQIPEGFPIPFGEVYHADYRLWHALLSIALGIGASLAGSLLPARRAARLPIAEAIGAGV
jgi:putative ABC transport system permease protein